MNTSRLAGAASASLLVLNPGVAYAHPGIEVFAFFLLAALLVVFMLAGLAGFFIGLWRSPERPGRYALDFAVAFVALTCVLSAPVLLLGATGLLKLAAIIVAGYGATKLADLRHKKMDSPGPATPSAPTNPESNG